MKNVIPQDHFRFKVIPQIIEISKPLYEDTGYINFHAYLRQYDNGACIELPTKKDWGNHFYNNYLLDQDNTKKRLATGINFWKRNNHENISKIMEDARDNFDIDGRIDFVVRDNIHHCYHTYSFTTDKKNADRAYAFYDIHRGKLLKFITYFKQKAAHLILESNKSENLIFILDYSTDGIENSSRDYAMELERENPNTKITDREFEIMLIYAAGYTTKNIAEMLNKSEKTIETHVHNIRQKYGFKDRIAMKEHLILNGHNGLEQFFFNYLPNSSDTMY